MCEIRETEIGAVCAETGRLSREAAGVRQRPDAQITSAKTMNYKYGAMIP
jgi:hypothetical protein